MGEYSAILPNNPSPHQSFFINPHGSLVQELNKDRTRSKTLNNIITKTRTLNLLSEEDKLSPINVESKSLYSESENDYGPFKPAPDAGKYTDSFIEIS